MGRRRRRRFSTMHSMVSITSCRADTTTAPAAGSCCSGARSPNTTWFSFPSLSADEGERSHATRFYRWCITDSHYGLVRDVCLRVAMLGRMAAFISFTPAGRMPITLGKNDHKYLSKHKRGGLKRKETMVGTYPTIKI